MDAERLALDARRLALDAESLALDAERLALDAKRLALDAESLALDAERLALDAEQHFYLTKEKSIHSWGRGMLFYKGNGRNVHVQTKGVYVWYVIYFTSITYHKIIVTSTFHNKFHMSVTN
ncbi:hypothetical protein [Sporosarcina luteola]|uniref:hypothetical protein n=1 Tax=Sporosarcina luteola TaxID=582850 RepID=UPI002041E514|nr:hypothetical protein [Sporosarcina luteola]MCM3711192.1 hypothetical protein [Sporosarcina luteola]